MPASSSSTCLDGEPSTRVTSTRIASSRKRRRMRFRRRSGSRREGKLQLIGGRGRSEGRPGDDGRLHRPARQRQDPAWRLSNGGRPALHAWKFRGDGRVAPGDSSPRATRPFPLSQIGSILCPAFRPIGGSACKLRWPAASTTQLRTVMAWAKHSCGSRPCAVLVLGVMGFPFIKTESCFGSTRPRHRANVRGWSPTRPSATAWSSCRPVRKSMDAAHQPAGYSTGQSKSGTAAVASIGVASLETAAHRSCVSHSADCEASSRPRCAG